MEINYEFVPEYESSERKMKSDIISYAGKLLEIVEANTLVVGLDNDNIFSICQGFFSVKFVLFFMRIRYILGISLFYFFGWCFHGCGYCSC